MESVAASGGYCQLKQNSSVFLYRNTGNGRFENVSDSACTRSSSWSASCAFEDIDNDGDVDLYVANYVDFAADDNRFCSFANVRSYCHPNVYSSLADVLYLNNGNGTFTDVTRDRWSIQDRRKRAGCCLR